MLFTSINTLKENKLKLILKFSDFISTVLGGWTDVARRWVVGSQKACYVKHSPASRGLRSGQDPSGGGVCPRLWDDTVIQRLAWEIKLPTPTPQRNRRPYSLHHLGFHIPC